MELISSFEVIVWIIVIIAVTILSYLFVKYPEMDEETTEIDNYYFTKLNELEDEL